MLPLPLWSLTLALPRMDLCVFCITLSSHSPLLSSSQLGTQRGAQQRAAQTRWSSPQTVVQQQQAAQKRGIFNVQLLFVHTHQQHPHTYHPQFKHLSMQVHRHVHNSNTIFLKKICAERLHVQHLFARQIQRKFHHFLDTSPSWRSFYC